MTLKKKRKEKTYHYIIHTSPCFYLYCKTIAFQNVVWTSVPVNIWGIEWFEGYTFMKHKKHFAMAQVTNWGQTATSDRQHWPYICTHMSVGWGDTHCLSAKNPPTPPISPTCPCSPSCAQWHPMAPVTDELLCSAYRAIWYTEVNFHTTVQL